MLYEALALTAVATGAILTTAVVWSRRNTWVRGAAVAIYFTLMPMVAGAAFFSLSNPAPWIQTITVPGGDYLVLGAKMVQDEAIYVWLDFGADHPRYFALPWSNETADKMQDMLDAQRRGEIPGFKIIIPYEWSWDKNPPQFHPLPQPKMMPDKPPQVEPPQRYEREA